MKLSLLLGNIFLLSHNFTYIDLKYIKCPREEKKKSDLFFSDTEAFWQDIQQPWAHCILRLYKTNVTEVQDYHS